MHEIKDRLVFKENRLDNGITVYSYPMNVPFASITLCVPFGDTNNTAKILSGSAHFLEHMILSRSELYPDSKSFIKTVKHKSGNIMAMTGNFNTIFDLEVRADLFCELLKGLVSHVFHPIFRQDDLELERGIVCNERKMVERWFPGSDELENYLSTDWKYNVPCNLKQKLGCDSDIADITLDYLDSLHKRYSELNSFVFIGGNFDLDSVCEIITDGNVEAKCEKLEEKYDKARWVNKEYHEKSFDDISRFNLFLGGFRHSVDLRTSFCVNFIGKLLADPVTGILYEWLREEKGWVYNIGFYFNTNKMESVWELDIPLNNLKQVEFVRKEIDNKIIGVIQDKKKVSEGIERYKSASVFNYQTLDSIIREAAGSLFIHGRIVSETESLELLDSCKDPQFLLYVYENYFSPHVRGEFLAKPQ
jgi:predicted Zn-dependent peptidase